MILVGLLGATGAAIFFVGNLFTLVTTFGIDKRMGVASVFIPFLSILFCLEHRERAAYPLKLVGVGLALICCALIIVMIIR